MISRGVQWRRRENGAVLVETALTIPVILAMIFGLIELSFLLKDQLTLRAASQDAARTATVLGDDLDADYWILQAALETGSTLPDDSITRIVVYRADTPSSAVPPACLVGGQDSGTVQCNSYTPADFTRPQGDFVCDPLLALDRFWCPSDREVIRTPANGGPPDFIGVHIEVERELLTGAFGASQNLSATYVLRIEPREL